TRLAGGIIIIPVRVIIAYKQRPSIKTGLPGLIYFIISTRAAGFQTVVPCIRADIAPIKKPCFLIYRDTIWIAVTHYIDLRLCFLSSFRKKISFWHFITSIRQYFYT